MEEKDKEMNELNKKIVNFKWGLGILVFIIVELLVFVFYVKKNESIQMGDLISISSGLVSISLGLVAIILAISQNNQATTKEGNANNILEQIKDRIHTVGVDTKSIQSNIESLAKSAEIKKALFEKDGHIDIGYMNTGENTKIATNEEKINNEGEALGNETQQGESKGNKIPENETQQGESKSNEILENEISHNNPITRKILVKKGDIFYADLSPTVGSEQGGVRPVIIVQNEIGNKYSPTVTVVPATSQITRAKLPTHVELSSIEYGFTKDVVVLAEQMRCIDRKRLKERVGTLSKSDLRKIDVALLIQLGIS